MYRQQVSAMKGEKSNIEITRQKLLEKKKRASLIKPPAKLEVIPNISRAKKMEVMDVNGKPAQIRFATVQEMEAFMERYSRPETPNTSNVFDFD